MSTTTQLWGAAATIVAAAIAFAGALAARYVSNKLDNKTDAKKFRNAILAEINEMDWLSIEEEMNEQIRKVENEPDPFTHSYIPTDVFDSLVEDIGLLSADEIGNVIRYYNTAHIVGDLMEKIETHESIEETEEQREKLSNSALTDLRDYRTHAADSIASELNDQRMGYLTKCIYLFIILVLFFTMGLLLFSWFPFHGS